MTITMDQSYNVKTYKCKAKENWKVLLSKHITFKFNFLPQTVHIKQPESLVENMAANLSFMSQPSDPSVEIVWRYNINIMEAEETKVKKRWIERINNLKNSHKQTKHFGNKFNLPLLSSEESRTITCI